MKQFNKVLKSTPLLFLTVMDNALATEVTVPLNFTTLPAITITEVTPMDFGEVLTLAQANTCTMSDTEGTQLTAAQEGADLTDGTIYSTPIAVEAAGQLSGDCVGDNGQVGIYEITSFADADITVSVTAGTATSISFAPNGYVTNLIETGTPARADLVIGSDVDVNASAATSPYAAAGTNRAIIGGTITNFATLTAGTAYTTDFNLNVIYQ